MTAAEVLDEPGASRPGLYRLRSAVVKKAAGRYGYDIKQTELRLYAGRFRAPAQGENERRIREWASKQRVGAGPIRVVALREVIKTVLAEAELKQYRDNPVLVTIKVLREAGGRPRPSRLTMPATTPKGRRASATRARRLV